MVATVASLPSIDPGRAPRIARPLTTDIAICASMTAALAHAVTTPSHLQWWPASGVLFMILALAQAITALLLLRDRLGGRAVLLTLWGTVGVIALYLVSRTVGLPFSPGVPAHGATNVPGRAILPGGDRHVGPLDLLTLAAEVLLVVLLLAMLDERRRSRTGSQLMWGGLAMWAAVSFGVLA